MSKILTFLSDGIGIAVSAAGWMLCTWGVVGVPIIILVVMNEDGAGPGMVVMAIAACAIFVVVLGLFLKWLGQGAILRRKVRTILLGLALVVFGLAAVASALGVGVDQGTQAPPLDVGIEGVLFALCGIILVVSLFIKSDIPAS